MCGENWTCLAWRKESFEGMQYELPNAYEEIFKRVEPDSSHMNRCDGKMRHKFNQERF